MFCPTKWGNRMKEKLRSSRGMTLTELLVALAIMSLIGVSMTVGINSAVKVYRDATRVYEAETLCGTILTYLEDEFRFGRNIRNKTVTVGTEPYTEVIFDSQSFGKDVKVSLADGKVLIVDKDTPAPAAPAAVSAPADPVPDTKLLADRVYTSGLMVKDCIIVYNETTKKVTITVAVGPDEHNTYAEHTVTVAPVYN